jgi:hypothetical protein
MIDRFQPGQKIRCTLTKAPRTEARIDTIERLMRQEPSVQKGLRRAQRRRRLEMNVYNRGNRDWYSREKCAKIVDAVPGATWTMTFTCQLAPDLASVQDFLTIEAA